ncbi:BTAD domain-containing putative transcriptional regulator [Streptomyces sp. NPDC005476]|uniref:AfsR/SARP family transcriptional regulator n=1 Tax=Streptomyces sp. NPDC005476 TaxID=3156882 RepID=UPI003456C204
MPGKAFSSSGGAEEDAGTGSWTSSPSASLAPPTGALVLSLLGPFRLEAGNQEIRLPIGAQRVLALLALQGRMSRSRLAGTLWPDSTEDRARACLRTSLWRANQASRGVVSVTSTTADLSPAVTVDVQRLVQEARNTWRDGSQPWERQDLPGDVRELLPDWDDEWLNADRERMRQLQMHVQEAFAERLTSEGRYGLALEVALAAMRLDVARESAHRAVIRVHLAEGNLSEARRAYDTCQRVLREELGVGPSPATAQMLR